MKPAVGLGVAMLLAVTCCAALPAVFAALAGDGVAAMLAFRRYGAPAGSVLAAIAVVLAVVIIARLRVRRPTE